MAKAPKDAPHIEDPTALRDEDRRVAAMLEHTIDAPVLAAAVAAQVPADRADTLEALEEGDAAQVLGRMEVTLAAEALEEMLVPLGASVLEDLIEENPEFACAVLQEMAPDDATDLLQELDDSDRDALLAVMDTARAEHLRGLLKYDEESAGGMMTTEFLSIRNNMTVAEATDAIRSSSVDDGLQFAFVVDQDQHLRGTIGFRKLLLAHADDRVSDLCEKDVAAIEPELDREQVAHEFEKYDFLVLPVVNHVNRLLGVVEVDDVIEIIRAESTEDAQRMVGAGAEEAVFSSATDKLKGRFPWLFVNLLTSSIAAIIVLQFNVLISQIAVLAVLMPVIANQAGNAGQQSLAVTLRGIVLNQVRPNHAMPLIMREALVGAINGLLGGIMVGGVVATIALVTGAASWHLGLVAGVSMTAALAIGTFTGSALPIAMKRLGFDPATASTIFLTMVTDSMSFFIFLGLAALLQNWLIP